MQDEANNGKEHTDKELKNFWHMRSVVGSGIHPDTNQVIPWAMRTSAFVPTNIPIIGGMLLTAPTAFNTFLW